ncbi:MAG TPA: glycosyltransferase family 4 protein [Patescibacteria group bacterium]|nr:glycosyltransferase family 4 protein [Patescibacteria group bacterium]
MKIGLVCPYNINKHGGVLEVVLALNVGLVKLGHEVKIITPKPRGHKLIDSPDIIYIGSSTDFRSPASTTTQISSTDDGEKIDAILESEKFDVLHFHEPWVPLLSRQLLQRSRCVNIATFHSKVPEAILPRTLIKVITPYLKSVMSYLHELTAVSPSGAEYAATLTDQPISIIPNGIDLNKYQIVKKKDNKRKTILYIGRLERRKGLKYLLRAFQLFSQENPDVHLIIAGEGPEREKLELLAEDLNIKNVSFLGYISEDLKLKLLSETDLFCSPAIFGESFGIVLLEAMSMGAVTIAGNNSGYSDLLQGVGAISIVNPEDIVEFARRLETLFHEVEIRQLWQKWATKYVKQFNYPHIVKQYEAFYKEAIKEHKGEIQAVN